MKIIWAQQPFDIDSELGSIFLAGPTLRGEGRSWRKDALEILHAEDADINVFVPEPEDHGSFATLESSDDGYDRQVEWEHVALDLADRIVFWVPRDLGLLPGFTTNIEFGMWCASRKVILGYPPGAPKMKYFDFVARKNGIPTLHSLRGTLEFALGSMVK